MEGTAPFEVTNPMKGVAVMMTDVTRFTGRGCAREGLGQPIHAWVAKIKADEGASGEVTLRFSVLSTSESSKFFLFLLVPEVSTENSRTNNNFKAQRPMVRGKNPKA